MAFETWSGKPEPGISILKQKNLYIVGCAQYDIWDITVYFLLPELKYHYEK
jgi:hypothetical protein